MYSTMVIQSRNSCPPSIRKRSSNIAELRFRRLGPQQRTYNSTPNQRVPSFSRVASPVKPWNATESNSINSSLSHLKRWRLRGNSHQNSMIPEIRCGHTCWDEDLEDEDSFPWRLELATVAASSSSSLDQNTNGILSQIRRREFRRVIRGHHAWNRFPSSSSTTSSTATAPVRAAAETTIAAKAQPLFFALQCSSSRSLSSGTLSTLESSSQTSSPKTPLASTGFASISSSSTASLFNVSSLLDKTVSSPSSLSTKSPPSQSNSPPRLKKQRRILKDPDRELVKQIRIRQQRQKETKRLRTVSNVYRALVGNVLICGAKLAASISSGSSGLLAEFVHSLVDCGNQALLLIGLRHSSLAADRAHPYGYGKNVYFWALVSALGTFFLGAGVSMTHALQNLAAPSLQEVTSEVWSVLIFAFAVDGYVFYKTLRESLADRAPSISWYRHLSNIRDPATLAILLEDGAACLGVVMALSGIVASHSTANPYFDAWAGVSISALLGVMGLTLVRVNHRFLLGQGVDKDITDDIERILVSRRSIDSIRGVQSQWTGPDTFSFKAEVDFDGTFLAAKLMPIYQQEFLQIRDSMDEELQVLLSLYAEDVMRTVEREVRHVEAQIRNRHPGAEYIELEPMSIHADRLAIDDNLESELRRVESDALNLYLLTLKKEGATVALEAQSAASDRATTTTTPRNIPGGSSSSNIGK